MEETYNQHLQLTRELKKHVAAFAKAFNKNNADWITTPDRRSTQFDSDLYYYNEEAPFDNIITILTRVDLLDLSEIMFKVSQKNLLDATKYLDLLRKHINKMEDLLDRLRRQNTTSKEDIKAKETIANELYPIYNNFISFIQPIAQILIEKRLIDIQRGTTTTRETKEVADLWGKAYEKSEREHRRSTNAWMILTALLLVIFIICAGISIQGTISDLYSTLDKAQKLKPVASIDNYVQITYIKIALKLVFSSMIFSILIVTFKNYKINEHHRILNRDRHLATKAIPHLMKATGNDNSLKLTILEKATDLLFDTKDSGYINNSNSKTAIGSSSLVQLSKALKHND